MDLLKYIESNRKLLEDAPWAYMRLVPPDPRYPLIVPGVIYCLKQKGESSGSETINPLQPYFIVYVRDDKVVRYTFAQPKQILEIFRVLCAGKTVPYEAICNLFDQETCNGSDMNKVFRSIEISSGFNNPHFSKKSYQSFAERTWCRIEWTKASRLNR